MADPAYKDLKAVKAGNVYKIPSTLHAWEDPGMGTALGTLWAAKTLYPGNITDSEFDETVKKFYKDIYNLDVTSELLGY